MNRKAASSTKSLQGAGEPSVRLRPGSLKHSVAQAGGWPDYAVNQATWTLPANPHGDDNGDGYTNLEQWLHQMAAAVEISVNRARVRPRR